MTRYLEHALRIKWLWLLPVLIPPLVAAGLYVTRTPEYDVHATIWAERALYLNLPDENRWVSPARMQVGLLRELLRTRAFIVRVARDTPLQSYTTDEAGIDFLEEYLDKRLWVAERGSQVIELGFRTSQPEVGLAVLTSVIAAYTEHVTLSGQEQAKAALDFYSSLLPEREQEFVKATNDLRTFMMDLGLRGDEEQPLSDRLLERSQLIELQRREDLARRRYEDTVAQLERIRLQQSARETAQERGFRVMDEPTVPHQAVNARRELLMPVAMVFAASCGLPLLVMLLMTWFDRTLRDGRDVQRRLGLAPLGSLPKYHGQRGLGGAAIRGLTLPAAGSTGAASRVMQPIRVAAGDD